VAESSEELTEPVAHSEDADRSPNGPPCPEQCRQGAHSACDREGRCDLAPIVRELQANGVTSLNGIAAALNARGVPTPAGSGRWHPAQVARLLKRLAK
jgi:hypothetical protein